MRISYLNGLTSPPYVAPRLNQSSTIPNLLLPCATYGLARFPSTELPARPTLRLKHPVNSEILGGRVTNDRRVGRCTNVTLDSDNDIPNK